MYIGHWANGESDYGKRFDIEAVRLYDEPWTEMPKADLIIERSAYQWLVKKIEEWVRHDSMKYFHMLEHHPIDEDTRERVLEDYENGVISMDERKKRMAAITSREKAYLRTEGQIVLGQRFANHLRAVSTAMGEQIEYIDSLTKYDPNKLTKAERRRKSKSLMKYDPRKKISRYNVAPWVKDMPPKPNGKPVKGERYRPDPKISVLEKKWKKSTLFDWRMRNLYSRDGSVPTFNRKALYRVGIDRGYATHMTLEAEIAEAIGIAVNTAQEMLRSGNVRWENALIIADLLEMTPAEFCDVFLHNLFKEVVDGKWVAVLPEGFYPPKKNDENCMAEEE